MIINILCFIVGAVFGFVLTALCVAAGRDREDE